MRRKPIHLWPVWDQADKYAIAQKHDLKVVEDACQARLAELNHKKAGTLGDLGCLSLQNSKNITCGEGGAILGEDEQLVEETIGFHGSVLLGSRQDIDDIYDAFLKIYENRAQLS